MSTHRAQPAGPWACAKSSLGWYAATIMISAVVSIIVLGVVTAEDRAQPAEAAPAFECDDFAIGQGQGFGVGQRDGRGRQAHGGRGLSLGGGEGHARAPCWR